MKTLISCSLLVMVVSWFIVVPKLMEQQDQYISEGKCIGKLVAQGVERKDIIVSEGTCYEAP